MQLLTHTLLALRHTFNFIITVKQTSALLTKNRLMFIQFHTQASISCKDWKWKGQKNHRLVRDPGHVFSRNQSSNCIHPPFYTLDISECLFQRAICPRLLRRKSIGKQSFSLLLLSPLEDYHFSTFQYFRAVLDFIKSIWDLEVAYRIKMKIFYNEI